MKNKIISMLLVLIAFILSIVIDFNMFAIIIGVSSCLSFLEFYNYKYKDNKFKFIKVICILSMLFIVFNNIYYRVPYVMAFLIPLIIIIIPILLYDKKNNYNISDIMYLYGVIVFLSLSYNIIINIYKIGIMNVVYIFLIAFLVDIYSYIGTKLIGKHPIKRFNKTIEGICFSILMSTFIGAVFYYNLIGDDLFFSIIISLILCVFSIVGDDLFYIIKSNLKKDKFSAKVIDQFDSILLISIMYMIILYFIGGLL